MSISKTCSRCKEIKPISQFPLDDRYVDGHRSACHDCNRLRVKAFRDRDPEAYRSYYREWMNSSSDKREQRARNQWRNNLRHRYGVTPDEYEDIFDAQGGVCAICGKSPSGQKYLSVDHCHETGRVRGLLCARCNSGIGLLEDSIERLGDAISYLSREIT